MTNKIDYSPILSLSTHITPSFEGSEGTFYEYSYAILFLCPAICFAMTNNKSQGRAC